MSVPYRLLFLDLDGTLVGSTDTLSPRTLQALHQAQQAGCTPVICTGRSLYRGRALAEQIGGCGYGIFLNGGILFDWETQKVVRKVALAPSHAREIVRLAHTFAVAPLCYAVEEDDRWVYVDRRFPVLPGYAAAFPERLRYVDELDWARHGSPVSVETYGTPEAMRALVTAWQESLGDAIFAYGWDAASYYDGCRGVHVHSAAVGKASAARYVADLLGVPRAQTLAIGDEANDLALLEWAGLGVAMGNGNPLCQARADHVTATVEEDGAALAIEQFVLRQNA